jgi:hypothetical protein
MEPEGDAVPCRGRWRQHLPEHGRRAGNDGIDDRACSIMDQRLLMCEFGTVT